MQANKDNKEIKKETYRGLLRNFSGLKYVKKQNKQHNHFYIFFIPLKHLESDLSKKIMQ